MEHAANHIFAYRIYLIDCPGVVPPNANDTDAELLLRGVIRVENCENPAQYVAAMLSRCQKRHIERTYGIKDWKDEDDFLEILARKSGRLLKGGDADADGVAKMVLNDFLRGRIPWYVAPAKTDGTETPMEGREGALGEMNVSLKRKRAEAEGEAEVEEGDTKGSDNAEEGDDSDSVAASEDSFLDGSDNDAPDTREHDEDD